MPHPHFHWLSMTVVPILQIKTLRCEPVFMMVCKWQAEPLFQARSSDSKMHIHTHRSGYPLDMLPLGKPNGSGLTERVVELGD